MRESFRTVDGSVAVVASRHSSPLRIPANPHGERARNLSALVCEIAIECVLVAMLVFMPAIFGGGAAWSQAVVLSAAATMVLLLAIRMQFKKGWSFRWSWAYLPLMLFLLLAASQLIPLSPQVISSISRETVQTKAALLADVPAAVSRVAVTFYSAGTWHDLLLVVAAAITFVVTMNVFRTSQQIRRLLIAVTIIGAAFTVLTLAQDLTFARKIYWTVSIGAPETGIPGSGAVIANSGSFINHNHFAQFMNLSLGATLALLLVEYRGNFTGAHDVHGENYVVGGRLLGIRSPRGAMALLGALALAQLVCVTLSLSRGGIIAACLALIATAAIAGVGNIGKASAVLLMIGLAALALVLVVGLDPVWARFTRAQLDNEARPQMLRDALKLVRQFPMLGTGLGTHEYVFPRVDSTLSATVATHLENEYVQVLEETGIIGMVVVVGFVAAMGISFIRGARSQDPIVSATTVGLGFGLLAVMIHSLSDFGQHQPANAILSAVFCGLLVSVATSAKTSRHQFAEIADPDVRRRRAGRTRTLGPAMASTSFVVALALAALLCSSTALSAARAESRWTAVKQIERSLGQSPAHSDVAAYVSLIRTAESALEANPADVKHRFQLSTFRWRAMTSIGGYTDAISPEVSGKLVDELKQTRKLCPTYGAAVSFEGQIEHFLLHRPEGPDHIRQGFDLGANDPTSCFALGHLEVDLGRPDESVAPLQRATLLDGGMLPAATDLLLTRAARPDLAIAVAAGNSAALIDLADRLDGLENPTTPHLGDLAAAARRQAVADLEQSCQRPAASAESLAQLARLYSKTGQPDRAIEYYRRAISQRYERIDWRIECANLLLQLGRTDQARRQAEACLKIEPGCPDAQRLTKLLDGPNGSP